MNRDRNYWIGFVTLLFVVSGIYLTTQVYTIYGGDAGDLVSAIVTGGIAHPPGYPLYTLLGTLLNYLPIQGTVAYKIGFLSTLPAILALIILYDLLYYLSRKVLISLVAVLTLSFTYPFWLFSVVVEVFSLNNLFIVLILSGFIRFYFSGAKKYLYFGVYLFGLSLTHHHIIIFLLPCLVLLFLKQKNTITRKIFTKSAVYFFLGLIPYYYPFVQALKNPAVNWMGQPTLTNFLQLVMRTTYGTFKAGSYIANENILRLMDIYGFAKFAYQDFRIAGVVLIIIGLFFLIFKKRELSVPLFVGFLSYLFFLYYASFPLGENFIVGTFERFVLPLYIFLCIFLVYGLFAVTQFFDKVINFLIQNRNKGKTLQFVPVIFLILPIGLLTLNFSKIHSLKKDFTAENFAYDMLGSVPSDSIILVSLDTPLFNSQYLYYTQRKWPDMKLIHFGKLLNPQMESQFVRYYPTLMLPKRDGSVKDQFSSFIERNYDKFPIFSKQAYEMDNGSWIPWGMLFRYYRQKDIPKDEYILSENQKVWSFYHDPMNGSLSTYKHLLLSDTIRIYTLAHQEIGFWAAKKGFNKEAEIHLLEAEKLNPADLDSQNVLSQVYIMDGKCDRAEEQINFRMEKDPQDEQNYLLLSLNEAICRKDKQKAIYFSSLYEEALKKKQTPLKKL